MKIVTTEQEWTEYVLSFKSSNSPPGELIHLNMEHFECHGVLFSEYEKRGVRFHRTDGPARWFKKINLKEYWVNGRRYYNKEFFFKILTSEEKYNAIWNI